MPDPLTAEFPDLRLLNPYLSEVEIYIDCIISEAEADYKMLKTILENSLNEKISDVQYELDNARNDLEAQRP